MFHIFCTTQILSSYQVYVSTLLCELALFAILVIVLGVLAETAPVFLVNYKYHLLQLKSKWNGITQRTKSKSTGVSKAPPQQATCEAKQHTCTNTNNDNIGNYKGVGCENARSLQDSHTNKSNMRINLEPVEREECRNSSCCELEEHKLQSQQNIHNQLNLDNNHIIAQEDAVIHEVTSHNNNNYKAGNSVKHKNSVVAETNEHPAKSGLLHNTLDTFFDMEGLLDEALTESMTESAKVQQTNSIACKTKLTNNIQNANDRASRNDNNCVDNGNIETDRLTMQRMCRPFASRRRRQNANI